MGIVSVDIAKTNTTKCEQCKVAFEKEEIRVNIKGHGFKFPKIVRYHPYCITNLIEEESYKLKCNEEFEEKK